jgi:hypothetical protein
LGAGFSTIVLVAGAIFLYCYCRRSGPQPSYAGPQVILPQAVVPQVAPAPAQPVYQPPSQSTYQAPSSAGHVYQYISPRRFRQRRSRSRLRPRSWLTWTTGPRSNTGCQGTSRTRPMPPVAETVHTRPTLLHLPPPRLHLPRVTVTCRFA